MIYVSAESMIMDLRIVRSLLKSHNTELFATSATLRAEELLGAAIERIEDAQDLDPTRYHTP